MVVTGPAVVGKSTIVKALQSALTQQGELWLAIELDTFARSLPRRWLSWGEHQGRYARQGFTYARNDDGRVDLTLGNDGRRVLAAFHRSVAAVVTSGVGVICEAIVHDDEDWRDWIAALGGVSAFWIRLTATLEVLEAREMATRSAVSQGLARGMATRQLAGQYDIEIDTGVEGVDVAIPRIVEEFYTWRLRP